MSGRRTRRSASTDGPQTRSTHWCQETSVLKTIPAGAPEDDWPTFELTDVTVFKKDGKTIVNALDVLLEGPFVVRGNLIKDSRDQEQYMIKKVVSSIPIEIPACTRYSVGEAVGADEDDDEIKSIRVSRDPILWLSGRGAWFEIRPSKEYLSTYRSICDSIRLYYAMYDIHSREDHNKILKKVSKSSDPMEKLSEVFLCYVIKVGNGLTIEEVAQRCNDIAPFLINQFLENEGNEELNWEKTFFYKWIKKDHEDLFKKTLHALQNPRQATTPAALPDLPTRTKRAGPSSGSENAKNSDPSEAVLRTRSTRSRSSVPDLDEGVANQNINNGKRAGAQKPATSKPALPAGPHQPFYPPYAIAPKDQAAFDSLVKFLEQTFDELSQSKKGVTKVGIENKIYSQNQIVTFRNGQKGGHRIPVQELLHYCAPALLKVLDESKWKNNDMYPWLVEAAETRFEPISMPVSSFPYPIIPRGKSSQSNAAKRQATSTHTPSAAPGSSARDEDDDTSLDEFVTPRRRGIGKGVKTPGRLGKSSLRPVASSKKRVHAEVDADSDSEESPNAKKSHYFSDGDDTMEDAVTSQLLGDEIEEQVKIVIRADRIPSAVPKGPNDTWTCDHDDCQYIVRGHDAGKCQERIRQHFEEHEQESERVQLAMSESQGHLPINHLLDKIKTLGEKTQAEEEQFVGDVALPKPIQRKLIV